jgi:S-adenosylmethionine/arginine decarboxylase-like enzyme
MVDLWLDEPLRDGHLELLKNIVDQNLTVIQKSEYQFEPQGTTLVWILAESHFAVHTYPEHQYLSFDIYICNLEVPLEQLVDEMLSALPVKFYDKKFSYRGHKYLSTTLNSESSLGEKPFSVKELDREGRHALWALLSFTTIVAMCSLLYELLLAQTLATTMGNTVLRYNVTIGLYIASMGIGALLYSRLKTWWFAKKRSEDEGFVAIESVLGVVGVMAPFFVLMMDAFFQHLALNQVVGYHSFFTQTSLFLFNHSLIVLIGFVSGLELPLLMDMAKKIHHKLSGRVLAFDYFGTLCAALLFPLLLIPYFSLFSIGAVVAGLNSIVALVFMLYRRMLHIKYLVLVSSIALLNLYLFLDRERVHRFMVEQFYFLGGLQ